MITKEINDVLEKYKLSENVDVLQAFSEILLIIAQDKRSQYAAMAMQGLMNGFRPNDSKYSVNDGYIYFPEMAADAVAAADALLKTLSTNKSTPQQ